MSARAGPVGQEPMGTMRILLGAPELLCPAEYLAGSWITLCLNSFLAISERLLLRPPPPVCMLPFPCPTHLLPPAYIQHKFSLLWAQPLGWVILEMTQLQCLPGWWWRWGESSRSNGGNRICKQTTVMQSLAFLGSSRPTSGPGGRSWGVMVMCLGSGPSAGSLEACTDREWGGCVLGEATECWAGVRRFRQVGRQVHRRHRGVHMGGSGAWNAVGRISVTVFPPRMSLLQGEGREEFPETAVVC